MAMKLANPANAIPNGAWKDAEEFSALVREHYVTMYSVALARLKQREAAEDLTQEVFLRAFLQYPVAKGRGALKPWLLCVTRNLAIDWLRRGQVMSAVVVDIPLHEMEDHSMGSDKAPNAREQAIGEQEAKELDRSLSALTDEQREVVLLHYAAGLTKREIAERLGVHPSTVGRQMDQSLALLKSELDDKLRAHLSPAKARTMKIARTTAVVAAVAGMSASAQASIIVSASVQQGSTAVAAANALSLSGSSLSAMASAGAKGVVVMGAGKVVAIVAGAVIVASVAYYGVSNSSKTPSVPAAVAANMPTMPAGALPPLPPGWTVTFKPASPMVMGTFSTFGKGSMKATGMKLADAAEIAWSTPVRLIDPSAEANSARYDINLHGPGDPSFVEIQKVLQVEVQRTYGVRAVVENRTIPCLVLKTPGQAPAVFRKSTMNAPHMTSIDGKLEFKGFPMS
ncbi:MAG: RNA polymerase sigma factor, partial [Candidatus Sumerlaeota bacterium]